MSFLIPFMQERDTYSNLKDVGDDDNEDEPKTNMMMKTMIEEMIETTIEEMIETTIEKMIEKSYMLRMKKRKNKKKSTEKLSTWQGIREIHTDIKHNQKRHQ
ncbi:hypothetical protein ACS0PU_004164 [Formica fusca]